jgi:bifunctional DNase/RNase
MKEMIDDLHASVDRVLIKEVKDGTYFASIFLKDAEGDELEFDARPSDSLALSLRVGCPIFIADSVFDVAAIESPFAEEDEFQEFVEEDLDLREFRRRADDKTN